MPLTRRGWALVAGSVALATTGRALGVLELFVLAAGGMGLAAAAVVTVLWRRGVQLEGTRRLVPARVHAGADSRVELVVRNRGRRPSPVVTMRDIVVPLRTTSGAAVEESSGRRQARFHVAPLDPGESNRAAYRLGAERRGLFRVGPLEVVVSDPFGLVASTTQAAPATELTVYPRVEHVAPPPMTAGHDPRSGGGHPTFLGTGDEFYGLRAYEVGDDLRRVHWPSTARQDELMIRQHEVPWQGRTTVLLDTRAEAHTEESFEEAVSAAASLVTACWKRESQVRLLTTQGLDSGFGSGAAHLSALMEHLAVLEPTTGSFDSLAAAVRHGATGALVLVTTAPDGEAGRSAAGGALITSAGYGWAAVVLITAPSPGAHPERHDRRSLPPANLVVRVRPGQSFGQAWNAVVAMPAVGAATRR